MKFGLWVVIMHLLIVAGVVLPRSCDDRIIERWMGDEMAESRMDTIGCLVRMYVFMNGELPSSLGALLKPHPRTQEPFLDRLPNDPWGNPYELVPLTDQTFQLRCRGRDGLANTEDDLVWPGEEEVSGR